jgi:hypothetical protein
MKSTTLAIFWASAGAIPFVIFGLSSTLPAENHVSIGASPSHVTQADDFELLVSQRALAWIGSNAPGLNETNKLANAIEVVLRSQISGEFDPYQSLMTASGGSYGDKAMNFVAYQRRYAFSSVPAVEWETLSDSGAKSSMIFQALDRRRAGWSVADLDPDAARFGTEQAVGIGDRDLSIVGQVTIFEFERLASLLAGASEGRVPMFWIRVPVKFVGRAADAPSLDVRVDFVYDEVGGTWIPASIMTIGPGSSGRPVLMM